MAQTYFEVEHKRNNNNENEKERDDFEIRGQVSKQQNPTSNWHRH